jgi:hypothetical protein
MSDPIPDDTLVPVVFIKLVANGFVEIVGEEESVTVVRFRSCSADQIILRMLELFI